MKVFEVQVGDVITVQLTDGRVVTGVVIDILWHAGTWTFFIQGYKLHSRRYRANEDV